MAESVDVVYERFQNAMWREKELINQRITWLLTSQSLLAAAYSYSTAELGNLLNELNLEPSNTGLVALQRWVAAVPWVSFVIAVLLLLSVIAAIRAYTLWQRSVDALPIDASDHWRFPFLARNPMRRRGTAGLAQAATLLIAASFVVFWAWVGLR